IPIGTTLFMNVRNDLYFTLIESGFYAATIPLLNFNNRSRHAGAEQRPQIGVLAKHISDRTSAFACSNIGNLVMDLIFKFAGQKGCSHSVAFAFDSLHESSVFGADAQNEPRLVQFMPGRVEVDRV